ncbi:hypothetical protein [Kineosporia babensis]|uniref:Uncharacterized protein n=1 Tax=Kineosporia babensis TaxID=499548 RepID=A0A9X1SY98_9ACTN|nr:hypothetical protein [Kineosporia babensis]MCD5316659.1 hypothetical protein [Kineosporia babensis]
MLKNGSWPGIIQWFKADVDRAFAAIVCTVLGAIALAGSATHVLHVGAYPEVGVSGWMVWTVAGSLEVLAAYSAWEMRRRHGWNRCVPIVVLLLAVAFIVLANLAAADEKSWAAQLPWAEAFAVAPPVSFLSVAAIAETREWRRAGRRARLSARTLKGSTTSEGEQRSRQHPGPGKPSLPEVGSGETLSVQENEDRTSSVMRWIAEGHDRRRILTEGTAVLGISESTMRREIKGVTVPNSRSQPTPEDAEVASDGI